MDNVCHTLVGVAVAQAGFKSRTALATATAALAANLPDVDVLVFLTDVPSVAFRRGITHGVPAQLLLPVLCAGAMYAIARRRPGTTGRSAHFGWLLLLSYIGIFTHVFLDFLNTYGIRLLSPMSQKWFYGDAVFIVDPWLWLILGAGVLLARKGNTRAARHALAGAAVYIMVMLVSARTARSIVEDAWIARSGEPPRALMVGPAPITPFSKSIILDAGDHYVEGAFTWFPTRVVFEDQTPKNDDAPGIPMARTDRAVGGLLVWSRFPFWEIQPVDGGTELRVQDMRFKGLGRAAFTAATIVR